MIARSVHPSRAAEALKDAGDCRPAIVGGVAIEKLESWLAAIAGTSGSEDLRRPEEILAAYGIDEKDTRAMVRLVENSGLGKLPADAQSLRRWLERARAALEVTGSDEPALHLIEQELIVSQYAGIEVAPAVTLGAKTGPGQVCRA